MAKKTQETKNQEVEVLNAMDQAAEVETKEVAVQEVPVQEFAQVVQNAEGKFQRKAVYNFFSSVVAKTRAEKVKLFNLLNGEGGALPMGEHVNATFKIQDVIFQPYDAVDEETGELLNGVLTYIFDIDGNCYVTSSKSAYFTLKRVFQVFGAPSYSKEDALEIKIVKLKGKEFQYIDLEILG